MGYFDGLASASFKSDADGSAIFLPYGAMGKGRLISDAESVEQLKKFIVRFYIVTFGLVLVVGTIVGWLWALLASPLMMLWYSQGIKRFIKDAPLSETNQSTEERLEIMASGMNKYLLWFFLITSFLFAVGSLFLVIKAGDLFLVLSGSFFAVCGFVFILMLRSKKK